MPKSSEMPTPIRQRRSPPMSLPASVAAAVVADACSALSAVMETSTGAATVVDLYVGSRQRRFAGDVVDQVLQAAALPRPAAEARLGLVHVRHRITHFDNAFWAVAHG